MLSASCATLLTVHSNIHSLSGARRVNKEQGTGEQKLVVRQPKIAGWRSAEEQGSRGEICTSSFPSAPPHLCPSACHHAKFPWQTTSAAWRK
ncbi:MAG: hypothetical protein V7K63_20630 [Nostoc sp.]